MAMVALALMVVVGGLLLGRTAGYAQRKSREAALSRSGETVDVLAAALKLFRADCSRYPTLEEGLIVLFSNPGIEGWNGPYINGIRPDPWGEPYRYETDSTNALVASAGPDGVARSPDDIVACAQAP